MGNSAKRARPAVQDPPPRTPERDLKDKPIELWTSDDTAVWLETLNLSNPALCEKAKELIVHYDIDGDGLLTLGVEFFVAQLSQQLTEDTAQLTEDLAQLTEDLAQLRTQLEQGWAPLESQQRQQRTAAESAEQLVEREFEPLPLPALDQPAHVIAAYHALSRNTSQGPARALTRNWTNQPHITRRYYGAPVTLLPLHEGPIAALPYSSCYQPTNQSAPWSRAALSDLLYHSLSCSARKDSYQLLSAPRSAWSKRVNPSSGGLHPVECHVLVPPARCLDDTRDAHVLHYSVKRHALEHRAQWSEAQWQQFWPDAPVLLLLSSVDWREIWKYGERAWRYVQLDVGHALGALNAAARALGWTLVPLTSVTGATLMTDAQLCALFGLNDARPEPTTSAGGPTLGPCATLEHERPALLVALVPRVLDRPDEYLHSLHSAALDWTVLPHLAPFRGQASRASWVHHQWPVLAAIEHATRITQRTTGTVPQQQYPRVQCTVLAAADARPAGTVLRTRRSALEYRPEGAVTWAQFRYLLAHVLNHEVWHTIDRAWGRHVHLALYIHRVEGLAPGYYVLPRTLAALESLRALAPLGLWTRPDCLTDEPDLPLYLLHEASEDTVRQFVKGACCHQRIAETASFVVSFVCDLTALAPSPALYRQLHWECGLLGQVLYQDAAALELMSTGLGCFLDDVALTPFNLTALVALYHFCVGPGPASHYLAYNCTYIARVTNLTPLQMSSHLGTLPPLNCTLCTEE